MNKLAVLALVAVAGLLSACNPFAEPAPGPGAGDFELCLQDGFAPCRDEPPTSLRD